MKLIMENWRKFINESSRFGKNWRQTGGRASDGLPRDFFGNVISQLEYEKRKKTGYDDPANYTDYQLKRAEETGQHPSTVPTEKTGRMSNDPDWDAGAGLSPAEQEAQKRYQDQKSGAKRASADRADHLNQLNTRLDREEKARTKRMKSISPAQKKLLSNLENDQIISMINLFKDYKNLPDEFMRYREELELKLNSELSTRQATEQDFKFAKSSDPIDAQQDIWEFITTSGMGDLPPLSNIQINLKKRNQR